MTAFGYGIRQAGRHLAGANLRLDAGLRDVDAHEIRDDLVRAVGHIASTSCPFSFPWADHYATSTHRLTRRHETPT